MLTLFFVGHQQTNALQGVAGGGQHFEVQPASAQRETVAHGNVGKGCPCGAREIYVGSRAPGQLAMSGDEVGMQMGLEDVADLQSMLLRSVEVDLHVTLRVDDDSLAFRRQQVRGMCQTAEIELFEEHNVFLWSLTP